ncbi:hypothetical protein DPMN_147230 [Dreissena polymorpha]|uniref:Uncharacterized protein n=1 Tax=Dreissena polymorpha TaxID=45954 RepID=A0A9D4FDC9_DREPO|nr:hypothetical protein DPMN_147230 [Dreissena polymorpha]
MAIIDSSNLVEFASRPRRMHQQTGRNYDEEGARILDFCGVLETLGAYTGYEGSVNCSRCGKITNLICVIPTLRIGAR